MDERKIYEIIKLILLTLKSKYGRLMLESSRASYQTILNYFVYFIDSKNFNLENTF